jgi:hypothetical protein
VYQEVGDQADDSDNDSIVSEGAGLNELVSLTLELMVNQICRIQNVKNQRGSLKNNKGLNNLMHVSSKRTLMRMIFDT